MSAASKNGKDQSILVVDDEAGVRESIRMIFENDYTVLTANNGNGAIKVIREELPEVILLDVKMPQMDGMETLRKIREINSQAKVIMITATKTVKNAVEAMKLGAEDYITKPFDVDEIRMIVKKTVESINLIKEVKSLRSEV
ncbi:MAG: response regulator, partial [bacterium]|nr:response regulator [bacterium]